MERRINRDVFLAKILNEEDAIHSILKEMTLVTGCNHTAENLTAFYQAKKEILTLLAQTRQETVREVIEKIDENYTIMREAQSAGVEWQLVALSLLRDDVVALGEEYGIKDE